MNKPARVYLDHNATAPLWPIARAAMLDALSVVGNPSSVHAEGRRAHATLQRARAAVGALVNAAPETVTFTSGATEANATVLAGVPGTALVATTAHASLREARPDAIPLPVDGHGLVRPDELERLLHSERPALVAIMAANNETGVIQPTAAIAHRCRQAGAHLHIDAVQAAGRLALDLSREGADSFALSAHKLGGPPGVGALVMREGCELPPLWRGGGQERFRRAGTENLPGIAGFAAAAGQRAPWDGIARLRDALEAGVLARCEGAVVAGSAVDRLPNTSCIITPGLASELQVMAFDLDGIAVSAGAACSSGKVRRSHVLEAMGYPAAAASSAIRVSLGWTTTASDVERFLLAYERLLERAKRRAA